MSSPVTEPQADTTSSQKNSVYQLPTTTRAWSKKRTSRIVVTAGPTREFIDPVRFISNCSTGKMGYEIAAAAAKRGHRVTLISGPTGLVIPKGVRGIFVTTALEMKEAVKKHFPSSDCLIMVAAVSDYRPAKIMREKIKKETVSQSLSHKSPFDSAQDKQTASLKKKGQNIQRLFLELEENPDILLELGRKKKNKILVGFALETEDVISNAKAKLERKNLDFIVATQMKKNEIPFGEGEVSVVIIDKNGLVEKLPKISKKELSSAILDKIDQARYFYPSKAKEKSRAW